LSWARRPRFWIFVVIIFVACGLAFAMAQTIRAERNGASGRAALARAEQHINERNVGAAHADLVQALADFQEMHKHLGAMGPLAPVARVTPFVRIQIRGATDFAQAGELLSQAGLHLVDAAGQVIDPKDPHLKLSDALAKLVTVRSALNGGIAALDNAADKIRPLDGYRLVGPLDRARADLQTRLPRVGTRAVSTRNGLDALIDMLGGSGARRFLLLSQNPDEVRPTGGFIGTYGVLATQNGHLTLDQYASTSSWYEPRPQAVLPIASAAQPLQLGSPPQVQTLANVNATADFPTGAQLAAQLWKEGGEQPVNGVISITPAVMARILGVLGPVQVPGYPETINAGNLAARVDYHLHFEAPPPETAGGRKAFLIELVHVVVQKLLDAPASKWEPLATAIGAGFNNREAMAWSSEPAIENALVSRSWQGTLPRTNGDFFYEGEFEYAAKNGEGLQRTFDHNVVLHADGSAKITTKVTIKNTLPPDYGYDHTLNEDSLSFITLYGPNGATLAAGSDPPDASTSPLNGHPANSWFESANPLSSTTFTVAWNVPKLLTPVAGGAFDYQLKFMRLAAHNGDVLHLHVTLPRGWHWASVAPPATTTLSSDVNGAWRLTNKG
jgi:hypothetical protein